MVMIFWWNLFMEREFIKERNEDEQNVLLLLLLLFFFL